MALSEALKEVYSSNPVDARAYETMEFSHSLFSKTYYFVIDDKNHDWKLEDGSIVTFEAYEMKMELPEVGSTQQDLLIVLDDTEQQIVVELERAIKKPEESIKSVYRVYVDGYDEQQRSPISLSLTNIVSRNGTVSASASRPNLYAIKIPSGIKSSFDQRFHGLFI